MPSMSRRDLAKSIEQKYRGGVDTDIIEAVIGTGTILDDRQIAHACKIVRQSMTKPLILDALLHLEYSQTLVWGFMVGSFYESHYSWDRRELSRYELERVYFENRFRYDSAFVSAFRGIECILGKPHFKNTHISELLSKTDKTYGTAFTSGQYRSSARNLLNQEEMVELCGFNCLLSETPKRCFSSWQSIASSNCDGRSSF